MTARLLNTNNLLDLIRQAYGTGNQVAINSADSVKSYVIAFTLMEAEAVYEGEIIRHIDVLFDVELNWDNYPPDPDEEPTGDLIA